MSTKNLFFVLIFVYKKFRLLNRIKFVVVGCGHIGLRHAYMVEQNEEAELVAICDPNKPTSNLDILENKPFFKNIDDLLASDLQFDVVCICSPNHLHTKHALKALEKRKHILIEKPMGLSKADCEKILHKALNVSRQVFCVMQNRYSLPAKWLKELISRGIIGTPHLVSVNCFWNRDERYYLPNGKPHSWHGKKEFDGGTLFTQFSHFIDLLYWLFGDIKIKESNLKNFTHEGMIDFEDSGIVNFELAEGGIGVMSYSTSVWDKNFESTFTLIGSKGTVKLGGQYMDKIEYCHIENYTQPDLENMRSKISYGKYKGAAANHYFLVDNVIKVLAGENDEITTNALDGMKTVEIIERIYNSQ